MSKMDDMRAMREARYAERNAAPARPATRRLVQPAAEPTEATPASDSEGSGDVLCGHRAISGRTCTRERGHSAKSHRYS
jgi:hypothetical protein